METIPVRLGKKVNGKRLDGALLNAAVEAGLCVNDRKDEFHEEYKLNPARREKVYGKTTIKLGEGSIWFADFEFNRERTSDSFCLERRDGVQTVGYERLIHKYLDGVFAKV